MPSVGFEPPVPASKWVQTRALDRTATGIKRSDTCIKRFFLLFLNLSKLDILNYKRYEMKETEDYVRLHSSFIAVSS